MQRADLNNVFPNEGRRLSFLVIKGKPILLEIQLKCEASVDLLLPRSRVVIGINGDAIDRVA